MKKVKALTLIITCAVLISSCDSSDNGVQSTTTSGDTASGITTTVNPDASDQTSETTEQKPTQEFTKRTNKYAYEPMGYMDEENRYLMLKNYSDDNSFYDYMVFDQQENTPTYAFDAPELGEVGKYDSVCQSVSYSGKTISIQYSQRGEDDVYTTSLLVVDVYGNELINIPETDGAIGDCQYVPEENAIYYTASEDGQDRLFKADSDGGNPVKISDTDPVKFFVLDDEIVYVSSSEQGECFFGIMDKSGNAKRIISIGYVGGARNRRLIKAGDYICFMSPFEHEIYAPLSDRTNGVILYNYKTGELNVQYFEKEIENGYCGITPNGKYLISCVPDDVLESGSLYTRNDTLVNVYDTSTCKLIKSEKLGKEGIIPKNLLVFDDMAVFSGGGGAVYKLNF